MRLVILFCLILAPVISTCAANRSECRQGQGTATEKVAEFEIHVAPYPDKDNPDFDECEAEIYDPRGDVIFSEHDWGFAILLAGRDVNGDGIPDLVLEAFSGGMHCCWTYYFFSLGPHPGLFLKFENNRDASIFEYKKPRQIYLEIQDGAFDYFDEVCHACSPFPLVYLLLDGPNLVDISREFVDNYDEIIRVSRKALTQKGRRRLKALTEKPSDADPVREARYNALMIVFAYLYSGREEQAHQALQELWPPFDQERIWKLILDTRRDGILCYTRKDAVCGSDALSK